MNTQSITVRSPVNKDHMLTIRITPEFRKQLRHFAADKNVSLSEVVKVALNHYLTKAAH